MGTDLTVIQSAYKFLEFLMEYNLIGWFVCISILFGGYGNKIKEKPKLERFGFHGPIISNFSLICLSLPTNIKYPHPSINRETYVWERKVQDVFSNAYPL